MNKKLFNLVSDIIECHALEYFHNKYFYYLPMTFIIIHCIKKIYIHNKNKKNNFFPTFLFA